MDKRHKITIFHIYRKDGTSMFLHPFADSDFLLKLDDSYEIVGKYGEEPRVENFTMFKNELYRLIDSAVKSWINDKRFIPHFIISSGVFLIVYLIASLVVRDPVPLIDELLLAFGGSIFTYFYLSRKGQSSEKSAEKRLSLRVIIDRIMFSEDPFVKDLEKILHYNETADTKSLINLIHSEDGLALNNNSPGEITQLLSYLDNYFSTKPYGKKINKIEKLGIDKSSKWAEDNKVDLSLLVIYKKLRKQSAHS